MGRLYILTFRKCIFVIMFKYFFIFIAAIYFESINAQSIFLDLSAQQFGDSISISWTLEGGTSCTNMELGRSTDNLNYETVFVVGGTCGAADDSYYNYTDSEMLIAGIRLAISYSCCR